MYKIRKVKYVNHPILKNLELDFSGPDGTAVDTVILAGENGTGKSTVMDSLYRLLSKTDGCEMDLVLETDAGVTTLAFRNETLNKNTTILAAKEQNGKKLYFKSIMGDFHETYPVSAIYSDVDINFHSKAIANVTSLTLDAVNQSRRSDTALPEQIKQLIIDVQAMDDADLAYAYRQAKDEGTPVSEISYADRMQRFTTAFNTMFENMTYSRVVNINRKKAILFKKYGEDILIDGLSSGEKQVVYRGCFLLKDVNAMNGAFVFIDEPEISLHPNWQMKIMDYYKGIFTGEDGQQTSQIFAVTHSPFVIHNDNRRNDKIIILTRNENGDIVVKDKPEYFKCDSVEAVQDAFSLKTFSAEQPTVYLEGRTDEKYFNRVLQVYDLDVPFRFKWVGYLDDKGQEVNTGEKSIDAAYQFLVSQNLPVRNICLKDCDTNREPKRKNNAIILAIPPYQNSKGIKKGIENALVLDSVDLTPYYSVKKMMGEYGEEKVIQTFEKMDCCDGICAMDDAALKDVFINLKAMIDRLLKLYNEE